MLANLRALFAVIIDIILLRRGPEAMPASSTLLALVVALNIAGSMVLNGAGTSPSGVALLQSAVGCVVMLIWFRTALLLAQKGERFLQTMSALLAVNAMFLPAMIPLITALLPYLEKADPANPPPAALFILTLVIAGWALVVQVRIVRAAFECPWFGAILLVLGEVVATGFISMLMFGSPDGAA